MKAEISALVDDELAPDRAEPVFNRIKDDRQLSEAWNTYHLIGDVLRQEPLELHGLSERVMARIACEPAIIAAPAPIPARSARSLRAALALAAAIAGVAAVGWVALSLDHALPAAQVAGAQATVPRAKVSESESAVPVPQRDIKEYLVAHQAQASGNRFQGAAQSVRTVSEIRRGARP